MTLLLICCCKTPPAPETSRPLRRIRKNRTPAPELSRFSTSRRSLLFSSQLPELQFNSAAPPLFYRVCFFYAFFFFFFPSSTFLRLRLEKAPIFTSISCRFTVASAPIYAGPAPRSQPLRLWKEKASISQRCAGTPFTSVSDRLHIFRVLTWPAVTGGTASGKMETLLLSGSC